MKNTLDIIMNAYYDNEQLEDIFNFSDYEEGSWFESDDNFGVTAFFAIVIFVVGIVGNLISMFVVLVLKEYKKSVLHLYVLQLALADTMFLMTIPFRLQEAHDGHWKHHEVFCKLRESILYLNYYASICFLMWMSVDRYIAVCHSFNSTLTKLRSTTCAYIVITFIWILCFLICIPVFSYVGLRGSIIAGCSCSWNFPSYENGTLKSNENLCRQMISDKTFNDIVNLDSYTVADLYKNFTYDTDEAYEVYKNDNEASEEIEDEDYVDPHCTYSQEPNTWHLFLKANFIYAFVIPVLVMVFTYGFIIKQLRKNEKKQYNRRKSSAVTINSANRKASSGKMSVNTRVTVMCTCLVLSFIVLWLPSHIVHLMKIKGISKTDRKVCDRLSLLGSYLGFLNSALNPYLYSFIGTKFSRRLKSAKTAVRKSMGSVEGSGRGQSMEGKANYKKGESSTNMATVTLVTKDNNRL